MLKGEGGICPYLMSEDLEGTARVGLTLRKANAHRLMSEMSKLGWVTMEEYPKDKPKQFQITDSGVEAFTNLQRRRLAVYEQATVPNAIALNHLHLMDKAEAINSLNQRREELLAHLALLTAVPEQTRKIKVGIELLCRQNQVELQLIDELIAAM